MRRIQHVRKSTFEEALNENITIELPAPVEARMFLDDGLEDLCGSRNLATIYPGQFFPPVIRSRECFRGRIENQCLFVNPTVVQFLRLPVTNSETKEYSEGVCVPAHHGRSVLFNRNMDGRGCDQWILHRAQYPNNCVCRLKPGACVVSSGGGHPKPCGYGRLLEAKRREQVEEEFDDKVEEKVDFVCRPSEDGKRFPWDPVGPFL
ncbi:hypothetical protein L596_029014 [Steinernema carpocapsae]|nr:hypothetical protein L596_029014 [Steinernema carpocapsae]